jgi:hypothetical protein
MTPGGHQKVSDTIQQFLFTSSPGPAFRHHGRITPALLKDHEINNLTCIDS